MVILVRYAVVMDMETPSPGTHRIAMSTYIVCMYHERCTPSQAHFSSPHVLLLIVKFIPTISQQRPDLEL